MTSIGRRSSLHILSATQRNRTRIKSAIKEMKGSLFRGGSYMSWIVNQVRLKAQL